MKKFLLRSLGLFTLCTVSFIEPIYGFSGKMDQVYSSPLSLLLGMALVMALSFFTLQVFEKKFSLWGYMSLAFLVLFFIGSALVGQGSLVSLALLILGIFLLGVEFFMPGFSIPGIAGLVALFASMALSMESWQLALIFTFISLLVVGGLLIYLLSQGKRPQYFEFLTLKEASSRGRGYSSNPPVDIRPGDQGITLTSLKPTGFIDLDGKKYDAVSDRGYIEKNCPVEVLSVEGAKILVRRK